MGSQTWCEQQPLCFTSTTAKLQRQQRTCKLCCQGLGAYGLVAVNDAVPAEAVCTAWCCSTSCRASAAPASAAYPRVSLLLCRYPWPHA